MKAYEIAELMETLSPVRYACDWDNVGMHVGRRDNEIKKILVTLDISDEAVDKAVAIKADMIISHHPLIFKGIKKVNESGYYDSSSLNYIHKMNIKLENILKDYSSWRESVVITEEETVKL